VDTSESVILKGRGISFQNGRHGIRKTSSLPNVVLSFLYFNVSKQMKTGYNKLSLSYR